MTRQNMAERHAKLKNDEREIREITGELNAIRARRAGQEKLDALQKIDVNKLRRTAYKKHKDAYLSALRQASRL